MNFTIRTLQHEKTSDHVPLGIYFDRPGSMVGSANDMVGLHGSGHTCGQACHAREGSWSLRWQGYDAARQAYCSCLESNALGHAAVLSATEGCDLDLASERIQNHDHNRCPPPGCPHGPTVAVPAQATEWCMPPGLVQRGLSFLQGKPQACPGQRGGQPCISADAGGAQDTGATGEARDGPAPCRAAHRQTSAQGPGGFQLMHSRERRPRPYVLC